MTTDKSLLTQTSREAEVCYILKLNKLIVHKYRTLYKLVNDKITSSKTHSSNDFCDFYLLYRQQFRV